MYHIDTLPFSYHKGLSSHAKLDKNGVIMSRVPYRSDFVYHATAIASYAIANSNNDAIFNPQINWILNNMDSDGSIHHPFKIVSYKNIEPSWIGGLAQGLSITALILSYKKDNKKERLFSAERLFNSLVKNCIITDNTGTWIQEYPGVPSILNGNIYSLYGIYDLLSYKSSSSITAIFNKCLSTIKKNLFRYDLGNWSRYDLHYKYPSTQFYNSVHVKQLNHLYDLTGDTTFLEYADKWNTYPQPYILRLKKIQMQISNNGIYGMYKKWRRYRKWK